MNEPAPANQFSAEERRAMLGVARQVFEARVRREPLPPVPQGGVFDVPRGGFVTIHHDGDLRGCLGRLEPEPLGDTIAHLAAAVADSDPRFDPVRPDELPGIDIEISVLTPERDVRSIDEIEVGRHGLIVEQGYRRGLLLPQVAAEQRWDRQAFLEHTCLKAGLPRDAWQRGATLYVFEAEVFGENGGSG